GVVADEVVVALFGVELQREAAHVAPAVGRTLLAGDGGEARQHRGNGAGLEQAGLGVLGDVLGDGQLAERAAALGVDDALRDALAVEVGQLLDQVDVVDADAALGAGGDGVLFGGNGRAVEAGGGAGGGSGGHARVGDVLARSHGWCSFFL